MSQLQDAQALNQLQQLVNHTPAGLIGQRLRQQPELHQWVLAQASEHLTTLTSQVHWLLAGAPDLHCAAGAVRKWVPAARRLGFCGNSRQCQCFRQQLAAQAQLLDHAEIVKKRVATWQQRWGVSNPSQSPAVQQRRRASLRVRTAEQLQQQQQRTQQKQQQGLQQVLSRLQGIVTPLFCSAEYAGSSRKNQYEWQCDQCGTAFTDHVDSGRVPRCTSCYPAHTSQAQRQLLLLLQHWSVPVISADRTILSGRELDLLLPHHALAVEFNGLYWHSERFRSSDFHVNKHLDCAAQGLELIQIWEDHWRQRQPQVLHQLRQRLQLTPVWSADQCAVVDITAAECQQLTDQWQVHAVLPADSAVALMYAQQPVAVLSFQRIADHSWQLLTYASAGTVQSGAQLLFSSWCQQHQPSTVTAHSARCWPQNQLFASLAFEQVTAQVHNRQCWWVRADQRVPALCGQPVPAGWRQLWDAGSDQWLWQAKKGPGDVTRPKPGSVP